MDFWHNVKPDDPLIEIPRGDISFRFGTRHITARSHQSDVSHPNVLFLTIQPTWWNRAIWAILKYVPRRLYSQMKSSFPEWILPQDVVLKMHKRGEMFEDWPADFDFDSDEEGPAGFDFDSDEEDPRGDEEFQYEVANYTRLSLLQGYRIPEFFGETVYRGRRAMIISRFFGQRVKAFDDELGKSPFFRGEEDLYLYLRDAYEDLGKFGMFQADSRSNNNYIFVNDKDGPRIVVIDLERVMEWGPGAFPQLPSVLNRYTLSAIEEARWQRFPYSGVPESLRSRVLWTNAERRVPKYAEERRKEADLVQAVPFLLQ